jgi:hypothetical protein
LRFLARTGLFKGDFVVFKGERIGDFAGDLIGDLTADLSADLKDERVIERIMDFRAEAPFFDFHTFSTISSSFFLSMLSREVTLNLMSFFAIVFFFNGLILSE